MHCENRSTRAAGHFTRLESDASQLLQDTLNLWDLYVYVCVCVCVAQCVREQKPTWRKFRKKRSCTTSTQTTHTQFNTHRHTSCWHDCGSRAEAHHHPAPWDNWRKARALWVMLLINSIQQTLRRYDYLSRTALLSPAMLIIVVSLGGICLFSFFSHNIYPRHELLSPWIWYHLLSNNQNSLLWDKSLMIKWSNGWRLTRDNKLKILLARVTSLCLNVSCNPSSL